MVCLEVFPIGEKGLEGRRRWKRSMQSCTIGQGWTLSLYRREKGGLLGFGMLNDRVRVNAFSSFLCTFRSVTLRSESVPKCDRVNK